LALHSPRRDSFYERHQCFLWVVYRALDNPADPLDAQAESTGRGVWIAKDVSILRVDHASIEGKLSGVWQALYRGCVLDFKEMNRRLIRFGTFLIKEIKLCKTSNLL